MSHYTTEVRFICEQYAGEFTSSDYSTVESIIENSRKKIFDFDFPIYDENYRSVLETKILKRYYTREIGFETVALWKFWLNKRLNEIMPYYNQLYKSATLEFNPFYDVDVTTTSNRNGKFDETHKTDATANNTVNETATRTDNLKQTTNSINNSSESGTQYDLYSDTPQGALTGVDQENYLTNARKIKDNSTGESTINETVDNTGTQENKTNSKTDTTNAMTGSRNYTDTDDYLEHVVGKRNGSSFSAMLQEYRGTFINIDVMIINELSDLFMNVW